MHALLDEIADQAKMVNMPPDQLNYEQHLQLYKDMITESYHDAIALSTLLEILFPAID